MQVVVDSLLTNYIQKGAGKVVLLLHGWGDNLKSFALIEQTLARNYQIIALDLPGFGQTEMPNRAWSLDDYADFIKNFLGKIGVQEVYAIIGHSNGGALAIRAVSKGVLQPEKLILLASAGIRDEKMFKKLFIKTIAKTGKVATFWMSQKHRKALRRILYGVSGSDMLVAPHMQETFKRTVSQDIQHDAAAISQPTLLIYGEKDKATSPAMGRRLSRLIPGSTLHTLILAGHFIHQDEEAMVSKLIKDFLQ